MHKYPKYLENGMIVNGWKILDPIEERNIDRKASRWFYECECLKCGKSIAFVKNTIVRENIKACDHIVKNEEGRECTKCGKFLSWDNFTIKDLRDTSKRNAECKVCLSKRSHLGYLKRSECKVSYRNSDFEVDGVGRICGRCRRKLSWDKFSKRKSTGRFNSTCKECLQEIREENREEAQAKARKRYWENRDKELERVRLYHINNREKAKDYFQKNKSKIWENRKKRLKEDPVFRLTCNLRGRINYAIRMTNSVKFFKLHEVLGCSPKYFIDYLENNPFGYKIKDISRYGLHVDHYIPCDYFDMKSKLHQLICFNYRNLRLLPWKENNDKRAKLPKDWKEVYENIKLEVLKYYPELNEV